MRILHVRVVSLALVDLGVMEIASNDDDDGREFKSFEIFIILINYCQTIH